MGAKGLPEEGEDKEKRKKKKPNNQEGGRVRMMKVGTKRISALHLCVSGFDNG
jgi:hypothetical protein